MVPRDAGLTRLNGTQLLVRPCLGSGMPLLATSMVSVVKLSQKLPGEGLAPFTSVHPTP